MVTAPPIDSFLITQSKVISVIDFIEELRASDPLPFPVQPILQPDIIEFGGSQLMMGPLQGSHLFWVPCQDPCGTLLGSIFLLIRVQLTH